MSSAGLLLNITCCTGLYVQMCVLNHNISAPPASKPCSFMLLCFNAVLFSAISQAAILLLLVNERDAHCSSICTHAMPSQLTVVR